ncbi:MAG: trypsin-like peptidase domain-containing protein [Alistipes senegalensis]|nr:trypsin-like peptidase domain-containing protein [Alistipes senegalensis]
MDDIENYIHGNLPEQENLTETVSNDNSGYENTSFAYAGFVYDTVPDEFQQYEELSGTVRKRKNTTGEKFIIFLFVVIILLAIGLSIYGIANDVYRSRSVMEELRKQQHIVMYQEGKPDGANDLNNFIDENGRYTIEGAAAAVKDSIVEIYTYSDAKKTKLEGTGSGVVISKDGYIVTNAHVLKSDGFHTVHTTDEKIYNAKIIGRDSKTDIAVIKVDNSGLTPAVLGNSDEAIVGEQVIAVGNPAGLSNTVTDGIISAVNRKIRSDSTGFEMNCIQTNADISPGNSGGALVNMYGQVIGITSSKYVSSSFEGLGFAITINEAMPIIEQLIDTGYVSGRFRIGIQLIDMDSEEKVLLIENEIGFELPDGFEGVYIDSISEDCDIANTELKAGDFITEINGVPIKTYDELYNTISASFKAGDKVPAKCANVKKNGKVTYYDIEFKLMEDTSGDF